MPRSFPVSLRSARRARGVSRAVASAGTRAARVDHGHGPRCGVFRCRNIRKIGGGKSTPPKPTGVKCPTCGEGELLERRSRRRIFYSCSRYPKRDFALNSRPVPRPCPKCAAPYLLEKETKREGHIECCNNPNCDYREKITSVAPPTTGAS